VEAVARKLVRRDIVPEVAGLTSEDAQRVRAAHLAMELTAWFVIVPLSFASR
jgi:hypothetical protein